MSTPVLNSDAMLNVTKRDLQLASDANVCLFFEKSMRDEVSYISKRYNKANNTYLTSFDPKQKPKHIIYLDANNLYVYAMSRFLPTNGFKWIDLQKLIRINIEAIVQNVVF